MLSNSLPPPSHSTAHTPSGMSPSAIYACHAEQKHTFVHITHYKKKMCCHKYLKYTYIFVCNTRYKHIALRNKDWLCFLSTLSKANQKQDKNKLCLHSFHLALLPLPSCIFTDFVVNAWNHAAARGKLCKWHCYWPGPGQTNQHQNDVGWFVLKSDWGAVFLRMSFKFANKTSVDMVNGHSCYKCSK